MAANLDPSSILKIAFGFWESKVLLTAVEFGLFTKLGDHAMTGKEIGEKLDIHPKWVWDFLDTLVSMHFLERHGDGPGALYRNTVETQRFLDRNSRFYIGGMLEMLNARLYEHWNNLGEALRTGKAQNETRHSGKAVFEELYSNEARLEQFMGAMAGLSRGNFEALAEKFDFSNYHTHCDIGGATGLLSILVAEKHPGLKSISFDLPMVEPIAKRHIEDAGLSDRVSTASGNFFEDPLPKADVITLSLVLHDWGLEKKKHIIKTAFEALREGGALVAVENIIDDERRTNTFGMLMSLNMLIEFGDAFDFTGADFKEWCSEAGFKRFEVIHLAGPSSAAVAYK